ncbi:DsrE family protein [Oleidesulfovibrio sp.]|uniref:DsrE family protein n=1 Tax=Oleidesulfovibrio sp. TaxID=2909707 RepID=UPI003A88D15D
MHKVVLFPFNGEEMCFIHVLLNAKDMKSRGVDVKLVVEGAAVKLLPSLNEPDHPMHTLYAQVKEAGIIYGACKACSTKLGVVEAIPACGIALVGEMGGHPAMSEWIENGYQVVTF